MRQRARDTYPLQAIMVLVDTKNKLDLYFIQTLSNHTF